MGNSGNYEQWSSIMYIIWELQNIWAVAGNFIGIIGSVQE